MNELFLIYLWEQRLLRLPLQTTDGQPVEVLFPGIRNEDAGPDFSQARIRIGPTLWAGSVEMHINATDWYKHHHDSNPAYENVVLHVVFHEDKKVYDKARNVLPTLEVKGHFDDYLLLNYRRFADSRQWLPCGKLAGNVQRFTWLSWLDRMATERMEEKTDKVLSLAAQLNFDWDEVFWHLLMAAMGFKVNQEAFGRLARALPFTLMLRHADQLMQLEALLLGTAGLLDGAYQEDYPLKLQSEYAFLKKKYKLNTMPPGSWKFMRMRPANFPTVRMAQVAMLVHTHGRLLSKVLNETAGSLPELFSLTAGEYWNTHYRPGEPSGERPKKMGPDTVNLVMINSVAVLLFAWGHAHHDQHRKDKALMLLEALPAENNQLTRRFALSGINAVNALHSQALLHLHRNYCTPRKCLECRIGSLLIRSRQDEIQL
ncbi:MAG TPA: DUF2851 family protein [Bacteroidales bacterium]|nr:DUF2851 family protein [Bacteroidales bacterium]